MFPEIAEIEEVAEDLPLYKPQGIDFSLFGILHILSGKRIAFKHKGVGVFLRVTPPCLATAARLREIERVEVKIVTVKGPENGFVQRSQGMVAADGDAPPNIFGSGQGNFEEVHLFLSALRYNSFVQGCSLSRSRPGAFLFFTVLLCSLPFSSALTPPAARR